MVPHAACVCQVIMARVKSTTGARNVSGVPTMADVAELSGLSRFTVSKVLNGSPGVSEKTKALVFETCERLSFVTNQHAASQAKGGPRLMGLVVISRAPAMARAYGIDAPFCCIESDFTLGSPAARSHRVLPPQRLVAARCRLAREIAGGSSI